MTRPLRACRDADVVITDRAYRDQTCTIVVLYKVRCDHCGWYGGTVTTGNRDDAIKHAAQHVQESRTAAARRPYRPHRRPR